MRNSFVFYRSFKDSLSDLSDSDKLVVYEAIADYALDKAEPHLTGFPKALFLLIRPQLDANWKRYEAGEKHGYLGAEYGKLGGRPKKEKPSRNPLETLYEPSNVNVNVNDNVNKEDCKGKKSIAFYEVTGKMRKDSMKRNNIVTVDIQGMQKEKEENIDE